jgi:hypothetical protein
MQHAAQQHNSVRLYAHHTVLLAACQGNLSGESGESGEQAP